MTRKRPPVHLSLSPEALAVLDDLATRNGVTRSAMVERLVRESVKLVHAGLPRRRQP